MQQGLTAQGHLKVVAAVAAELNKNKMSPDVPDVRAEEVLEEQKIKIEKTSSRCVILTSC